MAHNYQWTATNTNAVTDAVVGHLRDGAWGILPTETVYGLVCAASAPDGEARLRTAKGRQAAKPLQRLVGSIDELAGLGIRPTPPLLRLAQAFWPGPLTVVVGEDGATVGVRMPRHDLVVAVLRALGEPLIATSANPTGVDPAAALRAGFRDLTRAPRFVVTDDDHPRAAASTVVRLGPRVRILRSGAVTARQLHQALRSVCAAPALAALRTG